MKASYIFLADGFEEIEALAVVDVMRRAGMDVYTVSITDKLNVKGANGIEVVADKKIADVDTSDAEWLIAPGGMPGATNLAASDAVKDAFQKQWLKQGNIASICASPAVVLAPLGILRGQDATCYPTFKADLIKDGANYVDMRVVESGNIITSNGPSSALVFAFAIVARSMGEDVASSVASGMLV
ncbi:DJ-1 family glyoxalase III [uncultured Muribaculum sp.]|uniref:DJ-1 family glyoxalase III n=1 Tax=uncultured Muribaculum sp. TaxID=1918613 RepID=UPI00260AA7A2|nr:DJ-1 family glyoxalase III [uncultured Muribaculum sp.]